jgi:hypothetical protein
MRRLAERHPDIFVVLERPRELWNNTARGNPSFIRFVMGFSSSDVQDLELARMCKWGRLFFLTGLVESVAMIAYFLVIFSK